MKRVAANDPDAVCKMGTRHYDEGDFDGALKYWERAADLGNVNSHYHLSRMYSEGEGVEKDEKKKIFHLEEAAILGHPYARYNLACYEVRSGQIERSVKHLIIAANLGVDQSINGLKQMYKDGLVSKEDFAAALRGHHAAVNATKSPQREAAQKYLNEYKESVGRPSKW
jgi:TPR repeat protein